MSMMKLTEWRILVHDEQPAAERAASTQLIWQRSADLAVSLRIMTFVRAGRIRTEADAQMVAKCNRRTGSRLACERHVLTGHNI